MPYAYMVVSDTNGIIDYLYATTDYRLIQGASALLDDLNSVRTPELAERSGGAVMSAGGGEARVLFESRDAAARYASELQALYLASTGEVTLTTAVLERRQGESLADLLGRASSALRLQELSDKRAIRVAERSAVVAPCEWCGEKAAEAGGESNGMCRSCRFKLMNHMQLTQLLKGGEGAAASERLYGLGRLYLALKQAGVPSQLESGQPLPANADIAFLYADGIGIGEFFRKSLLEDVAHERDEERAIGRFREMSERMHQAIIQSVLTAAARLREHRIDYSLVGGDDFAAVLPASIGLKFTKSLLRAFAEESKRRFGSEMNLGAGLVYSSAGYPRKKLFEFAYDLMQTAKRVTGRTGPSLDYAIVNDQGHVRQTTMDGNRREENVSEYGNDLLTAEIKRSIRMGGYAAGSQGMTFERLERMAAAARTVSRKELQRIRTIIRREDMTQMEHEWLYFRSSAGYEFKRALDEAHPDFKKTPFPFRRGDTLYTPLQDMLDLYYLQERGWGGGL